MKSINWLVILLLTAGALLLWYLYSNIEFYEETRKTAWSSKALTNPNLAAQYFLEKGGIQVKQSASLVTLDQLEGVNTVIISNVNQVVNPRQLEKVLEWLKQGGNMIVSAGYVSAETDLLLDRFDVGVEWYEEDIANEDSSDSTDENSDENTDIDSKEKSLSDIMREYNKNIDEGKTADEIEQSKEDEILTEVNFGEKVGVLKINFDPQVILTHPAIDSDTRDESRPIPFSWSSSKNGVHLLQFDVGKGLLTIMSDSSIWESREIQKFDHAFLLWMLISTDGDVAFFNSVERQSLWSMAVDSASELLIALTLLVFFLLWHLSHRFGRIEVNYHTGSRSMGDHFSATANYLWHRKATSHLLAPLRNRVLRQAGFAFPAINRASETEQKLQLISEYCNIDFKAVETAFNSTQHNEITFVQSVRLLKQIEKQL